MAFESSVVDPPGRRRFGRHLLLDKAGLTKSGLHRPVWKR